MPEILPRMIRLFSSGFTHIAFSLALVYNSVRLLPTGHPYLNSANIGRFGIRHVIFEAQRNLVFSKENIDQIVMFFTVLIGLVLLFLQFGLFIGGFLIPAATAGSLGDEISDYMNWANFFVIPAQNETYDLAYRMLDLTFGFGAPRPIFNSCVIQGAQCQLAFVQGGGWAPVGPVYTAPTSFHTALHSLFHFYNIGILVVGFMIMMYMVVTVVAETAESGTPFGKRFNGMWAPLRLVVAIALLTPLTFGMNGAQLLTLMVAKLGSNLASNGWSEFIYDISERAPATPFGDEQNLGDPDSLMARPNPPMLNNVVEFIFTALTCRYAEELLNQRGSTGPNPEILPWLVYGDQRWDFIMAEFDPTLLDFNYGDIVVRFGAADDVLYQRYTGHVKPICGEIILQTKDVTQPGARSMQFSYWLALKVLWQDGDLNNFARNIALRYMPVVNRDPGAPLPTNVEIAAVKTFWNSRVPIFIDIARQAQVDASWEEDFTILGWVGAAIWYHKLAEYTGGFFSSVNAVPTPNLYPAVMEHVKNQRRIHDDFVDGIGRFNPVLSKGKMIEFESINDQHMAVAYYYAQSLMEAQYVETRSNSFLDSILAMFGIRGLINIHKNVDIHPLALLVGIGRELVESAITNLGFSFGSGVTGGLANILGFNLVGSVALAASSFAGQVALIGLSIGFILYYILPFLPFIYFFFAAGGWIKSIFEAMVGLPLWALAHVRIDGEGLPGPSAMNGYFLILEIFIRPLLIIFGLLAGIIIFSSQVQILNEIWLLVTSNIGGFDPELEQVAAAGAGTGAHPGPQVGSIQYLRSAADKLFFTVIYTIIIYMMGMSSFKLIDLIPNNILRWMNASVATFSEASGDPAAQLVQYSFMGSQMAISPLSQGMQGIAARAAPRI